MITVERLKEQLVFDASLGRFFWKEWGRGRSRAKGKEAGSFDAHGYGQVSIDGKIYKEHRLVWFYIHGEWPSVQIDHINHERRDNRIENLRLANNAENHRNRPMQRNNTTGHVGVSYDRGAYVAKITVNGEQKHLGRFKTIESAVVAREEANIKYGFHDNHGVGVGRAQPKPLQDGYHKKNAVFIELNGCRMFAAEWARQPGCTVTAGMIRSRINSGWDVSKAIFTPFVTAKMASEKRERLCNGSYAPKALQANL